MNCRRVQKLIPLHVEGDLRSSTADRVASHLEWCGRCNWLADEYKESQGWLRSSQPPEFDEAMLEDLKRGVLKRVGDTTSRPSLIASLAQHLNRRQILALSATVLILLGMLVLYVNQQKVKVNEVLSITEQQPPNGKPDTSDGAPTSAAGLAPTVQSSDRHRSSPVRRGLRPGYSTMAKQTSEKPAASRIDPLHKTVLSVQKDTRSDLGGRAGEMLRIEIQTGDPGIRIIWFAPKQTESQQSKPATD